MITIDVTLLIHIINIILLILILNKILYKPVMGILETRKEHVESLQGEVARFDHAVHDQRAEFDQKMRAASAQAKTTLDRVKAEAQAAGAEQIAAERIEAEAEKRKAVEETAAQLAAARQELHEQAHEFAAAMAEKIVGRSLQA